MTDTPVPLSPAEELNLSPAEQADAENLLAGLAEPVDQYAGLTPLEAAAAATSAHMSTCLRPSRLECVDCSEELHVIRRYLVAVEPVITEEATQPFRERLAAAELVCDIFGAAGWDSPRTERTNATEQAWRDWYAAYGVGVRTPDDVIAALAARRDEIRARALGAPVTAPKGSSKAAENTQEPCGICSGYGCPDCREETDRA